MQKTSILFLVFIGLVAIQWNGVQAVDDEGSYEEDRSRALTFLRRTIFHPTKTKCEEQKREAKEDYEERCEPSNPINRNQGTNRNCPELSTWDAFVNYEINDGYGTLADYKPNIKLPKLPQAESAKNFLKRTFFHPGSTKCEEQKREAREDYEERCEPSLPILRNTGTNRYCPDINTWMELDQYEIGNGYDTVLPTATNRYNDRFNDRYRNDRRRPTPPPYTPDRNPDYDV